MFGYTVPLYSRMPAPERATYQRYYCETCHQLKAGFGLVSTAAVNYDMTFNTIVIDAVAGDGEVFEGTPKSIGCVLRGPKADSDIFRKMAAYTVILTKWEIVDDMEDKPSVKTDLVDLVLGRAISKAEKMYPEYDETVGRGFGRLREMELEGCTDAVRMGKEFGRYLAEPLGDIAGDGDSPAMRGMFADLTAAVYVMDAVDDMEDDFMDGTYNPFLEGCPDFRNRDDYVKGNLYELTGLVNGVIGDLQRDYSAVRKDMKSMTGVTDNIVYLGVPESAKNAVAGRSGARMSVKNAVDLRKKRNATY